jgi:hypothetical protein
MALSEEQKDHLVARYEMWGPDQVRAELARADRSDFVDPEITALAQSWLAAKTQRRFAGRAVWIAAGGLVVALIVGVTL